MNKKCFFLEISEIFKKIFLLIKCRHYNDIENVLWTNRFNYDTGDLMMKVGCPDEFRWNEANIFSRLISILRFFMPGHPIGKTKTSLKDLWELKIRLK